MSTEETTAIPDVLQRIVTRRRARIAATGSGDGPTQSISLPAGTRIGGDRVRPFPGALICEIKRRSPSRGALAQELNPTTQADAYITAGATAISVLTEQDHFSGSLQDLITVREHNQNIALLRKDFLLTPEDIDVAWRAGADAVLLIAAILDLSTLTALYQRARELGLAALVEVHTAEEVEKIRPLAPPLVGINARDLRTFTVDLLQPLALREQITWPATVVFESGIFRRDEAQLARGGGFDALLVGEAVVKNPAVIPVLRTEMEGPLPTAAEEPFWSYIARRRSTENQPPRPLVKICGITNLADAREAATLGADVLGLVYAPSPRQAPSTLAAELSSAARAQWLPPRVGVVVYGPRGSEEARTLHQAISNLTAGHLAALQVHKLPEPLTDEITTMLPWPWYPGISLPGEEGEAQGITERIAQRIAHYYPPRILIDAWHRDKAGGTGEQIPQATLAAYTAALAIEKRPGLWLAGGLAPENIREVVRQWQPELIDLSSRLESEPGQKDPARMAALFQQLEEL